MTIHEATLTSKGQITVPVELRTRLGLKDGDRIEFFTDADGKVWLRRRDRSPTAFIDDFVKPTRTARRVSDDELIAAAVLQKDNRSKSRRRFK